MARLVTIWFLALTAAAVLALAASPSAMAQEGTRGAPAGGGDIVVAQGRDFNLFDMLFGEPRRVRRPRENVGPPRGHERPDRPARRNSAPPREDRNWQPAAAPKDPDARRIYVFGDAFAAGLARGLEAAFANTPTVEIVSRIKPASGVVRDDFYDWEEAIAATLKSEDIDIAVVMMGSNDRQPFLTGPAVGEKTRSEEWEKTYIARVDRLLDLFGEESVPLYWVGLPIMQRENYGQDMAFLNEVYQARTQRSGARFIDTWSRFADEGGQYASTGPDVNGQIRRLRNANGIHMTRTGNEKLAFFVEQELRPAIGSGALAAVPGQQEAPGLDRGERPVELDVSLTQPAAPPEGAQLAGGAVPLNAVPAEPGKGTPEYELLVLGQTPDPRAGRADDFAWPRGGDRDDGEAGANAVEEDAADGDAAAR